MAKSPKIEIRTSGRTYHAILDPQADDYPKSLKLNEGTPSKLGRGYQYKLEVTQHQLSRLIEVFRTQAEKKLAKGVTPEVREDGYAIKYDLEKLEKQLANLLNVGAGDEDE